MVGGSVEASSNAALRRPGASAAFCGKPITTNSSAAVA